MLLAALRAAQHEIAHALDVAGDRRIAVDAHDPGEDQLPFFGSRIDAFSTSISS
jgi:hypothetical protein